MGLLYDPGCRQGSTSGKIIPAVGPVGQLKPFTGTGKIYGMLSYNVTCPDSLQPYLRIGPLTDYAMPRKYADIVKIAPHCLGHQFAQLNRGAARSIFFHPVVSLDYFHVIVISKDGSHLGSQFEKHIDTHRHIRCLDAGKIFRKLGQFLNVFLA